MCVYLLPKRRWKHTRIKEGQCAINRDCSSFDVFTVPLHWFHCFSSANHSSLHSDKTRILCVRYDTNHYLPGIVKVFIHLMSCGHRRQAGITKPVYIIESHLPADSGRFCFCKVSLEFWHHDENGIWRQTVATLGGAWIIESDRTGSSRRRHFFPGYA